MKKILILSVFSLVLSACTSGMSSSNGKLERWATFDGKTIPMEKMGDKQATVYFYREKGAFVGPAVNVFVDGDYLASIKEGGYRATLVCSTGERIFPSFTKNTGFADRDTGIDYNFEVGTVSYVKILLNKAGLPVFLRVSENEGKQAIGRLAQQTQTLPRVKDNRSCRTEVVMEKITLGAHSLFKFDKSSYQDMLAKGKREIQEVANKINSGQFKVKHIKVVGYTDPMGNDTYNQRLSEHRAGTVKQALQAAGVTVPIASEGLGERNLLVRDCLPKYGKNRKARMQCDQPNRRVEIMIYGVNSR